MTVSITHTLTTTRSEFAANGFTSQTETRSEVIGLANGGYAVTYSSTNGATYDVPLVSIYDASGTATGTFGDYTIPYTAPNADIDLLGSPEVVELANGNVAVIWDSDFEGEIRGAILDPTDGSVTVSEFTVSPFASDRDPEAISLGNGYWVVAMSTASQVYLQIMDNDGNRVGGQFSTGVSTDLDPVITALDDDSFALTYTSNDGVTTEDSVFGAAYDVSATGVITESTADYEIGFNFVGNDNDSSAVAGLMNGNFAVVYEDSGWSGDGLTLQIFEPDGTNVTPGTYIRVDTDVAAIEADPDITVLPNGYIVVSWTDPFSATDDDIKGRIYTQSGDPVTVNGSIAPFSITSSVSDDEDSSIDALLRGAFITSWTDSATPGDTSSSGITAEINQLTRVYTGDGSDDTMSATAILDSFAGGGGTDTVSYAGSDAAVDVDLDTGTATGGWAAGDTFSDIEGVIGSTLGDTLDGDAAANILKGLGGADTLTGEDGDDTLLGAEGNDSLSGGTGNDRLDGGTGVDTMAGGLGNDRYVVDDANDVISGEIGYSLGGGIDTVESFLSYTLTSNLEILRLQGSDNLSGTGNYAPEALVGNTGNNILTGGGGTDQLNGKDGDDTLIGGLGADTLVGEAGNDVFDFNDVSESRAGPATRDFINFFTHVDDRIDLSDIDANPFLAGDQAFSFIGSSAFSGTEGQLRYFTFGGGNYNIVEADVDGDASADLQVFVNLTNFMQQSDFIL